MNTQLDRKVVTESDVRDYGVDHAQYFQGAGTAYTAFDVVFIGAGMSGHEAFEDALDQAASDSWDVSTIENDLSEDTTVPDTEEEGEDSELYHYVALYLR